MASLSTTKREPTKPVEFAAWKMKGEYRRSCAYTVIGTILISLLGFVVAPNPWSFVSRFLPFWVGSLGLWIYTETWRLRIDDKGIARRRLWCWSYWEWSNFFDGRVTSGISSLTFRCRKRPWWDRHLRLDLIETEAADSISRRLHSLIDSPTAPVHQEEEELPVAQSVVIYFGLKGRMQVTRHGIEFASGRRFHWEDLRWFRLTRREHGTSYLYRVEVCPFHGEVVSFGVNWLRVDGVFQWKMASRDAPWPRQLASLVPADRWQFFRTDGELESIEESQFRIDYWQRKQSSTKRMMYLVPPLMLVLGTLAFGPKIVNCWNAQFFPPVWKVVALVCLILCTIQPAVITIAMAAYGYKNISRRLRQAQEALERRSAL